MSRRRAPAPLEMVGPGRGLGLALPAMSISVAPRRPFASPPPLPPRSLSPRRLPSGSVSAEAWRHTGHFLMVNGLASFANQYTGLSVLHAMASPLSHALANVMKRAAVITMAFVYAQRPVTPLHLFGVALSVFGTLLYQQLDSWYPTTEAGYELVPLSADSGAAVDGEATLARREGGAVLVWPGEEGT